MRHLKFLNSLLFLIASHQSFSVVIDNFRGTGDSGTAVAVDESDLAAMGYAITRTFGDGVTYVNNTKFISFEGDSLGYIQYDFTSPLGALDLSKMPVIRFTFPPDTQYNGGTIPGPNQGDDPIKIKPFSLAVELKDDQGKYLSSNSQQATKNPSNTLSFDFSKQFSQATKFTPPSFNYNKIRQIYINLNSAASARSTNMVDFEISEIEAVAADPVPEPISMVTLGTGVAALIQKRRKKK